MPSHFSARTGEALAEGERDPLGRALQVLSHLIGSAVPRNTPMPISIFKAQYGSVLKQADHDGVALISQGSKRYVIVSEEHMVALSSNERTTRTVADVCMSLPRPHRAVDLSSSQMSGARGDIDVPARRY
jgi:hypothetical protein